MGTNQSRGSRQEQPLTVNHPRFSNTKSVTSGNTTLMETTMLTDEKNYQKWITSMEERNVKAKNYRFLLLPADQNQFQKDASGSCCGSRKTTKISFDHCPNVLTDVIESYKKKNTAFDQPELWHLLYALCAAEYEYASLTGKKNNKIGDIRPQNVFISSKGKIKVANPHSWPAQPSGHSKAFDGVVTYIPPEDMENMAKGLGQSNVSDQNSEQYAIGMTVLSAGILKQNSDLYNLKEMTFDMPEAHKRMNFWLTRQKYSQNVRIIVAHLCNFRLSRRWNIPELWKWLSTYRAKIGAHQIEGNRMILPDRFQHELSELSVTAPYFTSLPTNYPNQYYSDYQMVEVLQEKSSQIFEDGKGSDLRKRRSRQEMYTFGDNRDDRGISRSDKTTPVELQVTYIERTTVEYAYGNPEARSFNQSRPFAENDPLASTTNRNISVKKEIIQPNSKVVIDPKDQIAINQIITESYGGKKMSATDSYIIDPARQTKQTTQTQILNTIPEQTTPESKPEVKSAEVEKAKPSFAQSKVYPFEPNKNVNIQALPINTPAKRNQGDQPLQTQSQANVRPPISRPESNYRSPQNHVTPRPQVKYASPQPGSYLFSGSVAKKPVIKFTYGQVPKTEPSKSNVSKQSQVKSPPKSGYSQSHAGQIKKTTFEKQVPKEDQKSISNLYQPNNNGFVKKESGSSKMIQQAIPKQEVVYYPPKVDSTNRDNTVSVKKEEVPIVASAEDATRNIVRKDSHFIKKESSGFFKEGSIKSGSSKKSNEVNIVKVKQPVNNSKETNLYSGIRDIHKYPGVREFNKYSSSKDININPAVNNPNINSSKSIKSIKGNINQPQDKIITLNQPAIVQVNRPTTDRSSTLYAPTASSMRKEEKIVKRQHEVVRSPPAHNEKECQIQGHNHKKNISNTTLLKHMVGIPSSAKNVTHMKMKGVKEIHPTSIIKKGTGKKQKEANLLVDKSDIKDGYNVDKKPSYEKATINHGKSEIEWNKSRVLSEIEPTKIIYQQEAKREIPSIEELKEDIVKPQVEISHQKIAEEVKREMRKERSQDNFNTLLVDGFGRVTKSQMNITEEVLKEIGGNTQKFDSGEPSREIQIVEEPKEQRFSIQDPQGEEQLESKSILQQKKIYINKQKNEGNYKYEQRQKREQEILKIQQPEEKHEVKIPEEPQIENTVIHEEKHEVKIPEEPQIENPVIHEEKHEVKIPEEPQIENTVIHEEKHEVKIPEEPQIENPVIHEEKHEVKIPEEPQIENPVIHEEKHEVKIPEEPQIENPVIHEEKHEVKIPEEPQIENPVIHEEKHEVKIPEEPQIENPVIHEEKHEVKIPEEPQIENPVIHEEKHEVKIPEEPQIENPVIHEEKHELKIPEIPQVTNPAFKQHKNQVKISENKKMTYNYKKAEATILPQEEKKIFNYKKPQVNPSQKSQTEIQVNKNSKINPQKNKSIGDAKQSSLEKNVSEKNQGMNKSKTESRSAPKSKITKTPQMNSQQNIGIKITQHLVKSNDSQSQISNRAKSVNKKSQVQGDDKSSKQRIEEVKAVEPVQRKPVARRPYKDDIIDEMMGLNRNINRGNNKKEEVKEDKKPALEKSKAESRSAPKGRVLEKPTVENPQNRGINQDPVKTSDSQSQFSDRYKKFQVRRGTPIVKVEPTVVQPVQQKATAGRKPYKDNIIDSVVGVNKQLNQGNDKKENAKESKNAGLSKSKVDSQSAPKSRVTETVTQPIQRKPISRKPYKDDILDEVVGLNRQINQERGRTQEDRNVGLRKSKAESRSAPKSRVVESPVTGRQQNGGISIVQHLAKGGDSQSHLNAGGPSSMRKSQMTEVDGRMVRKSQKHFEFQHEDKVDFHYIHDVNADKKSRKSLEKEGVHYIKNPTESGGDTKHIKEEMKHLANLGTDGHLIRTFKEKHELIHDDGTHSQRRSRSNQPTSERYLGHRQTDIVRHSELVVADKNGSKLKTKSQKFILPEEARTSKVYNVAQDDIQVERSRRSYKKSEVKVVEPSQINIQSKQRIEEVKAVEPVQRKPVARRPYKDDIIDEMMGLNRNINRGNNKKEEVKEDKKPALEKSKAESRSAPKSRVLEKPTVENPQNRGINQDPVKTSDSQSQFSDRYKKFQVRRGTPIVKVEPTVVQPVQQKATAGRKPYKDNIIDSVVGVNKQLNQGNDKKENAKESKNAGLSKSKVDSQSAPKSRVTETVTQPIQRKPISRKPYKDDILDEVVGLNRQINQERGRTQEDRNVGLRKSKAESRSAPKSRVVESPVTGRQQNGGISIVQHLAKGGDSQSHLNAGGPSSMRKSQMTEVDGRMVRKSQKHFEFQHEDKVDFHYIHDVNADKKSRKSLEKEGVHYIKNPTESGGDTKHIKEEMKHLANLGTDGHLIRTFKEKHELIHDDGTHSQRRSRSNQPTSERYLGHRQTDIVRHSELVVADKNGSKLKTKSQKFILPEGQVRTTELRMPRATERFTKQQVTNQVVTEHTKSKQNANTVAANSEKLDDKKQISPRKLITRKPRGGPRSGDLVDDLLGFGKPKKGGPVIETIKEQQRPAKKDNFIEEVKQTNRKVNQYKAKK